MRREQDRRGPLLAWPALQHQVGTGGRLWLFLDYDGTLVPIAPTPEEARPGAQVVTVLGELIQRPQFRVAIVSGRSLTSLRGMLEMPGLILAGTYGTEMLIDGLVVTRGDPLDVVRPVIDGVRHAWEAVIDARSGFLLEDKGYAVALHARWATEAEAEAVLHEARAVARRLLPPIGYRVLGGHRFLEAAPQAAHKGKAVSWLLEALPFPGALPLYLGDDDKDAEAFQVVAQHNGMAICVGDRLPAHLTAGWLASPVEVGELLQALADAAPSSSA